MEVIGDYQLYEVISDLFNSGVESSEECVSDQAFLVLVDDRLVWVVPFKPTLEEWLPSKLFGWQVDHTTAGDSSRGCDSQVHNFEKHSHLRTQLDALTVGETQSHIVVQHSVHVLDPNSVDRSVEDSPELVVSLIFRGVSHDLGSETISPLLGVEVDFTIEFTHADSFGIKDFLRDDLERFVWVSLLTQSCHNICQHVVALSLATTSRADQHDTESNVESFIQVNDFLHKLCFGLKL